MLEHNLKTLGIANAVIDVALALLAFPLAVATFFPLAYPDSTSFYFARYLQHPSIWALLAVYGLAVVCVAALAGTYRIRELNRLSTQALRLTAANLLWALILAAALYVFRLVDFSRPLLVIFVCYFEVLLLAHQLILRATLRRLRAQGKLQRTVLLVGTGPLAASFRSAAEADAMMEHVIAAQIGATDDLAAALEAQAIDECALALEADELALLPQLIATADHYGVRVRIVPVYCAYAGGQIALDRMGDASLLSIRSVPLDSLGNAAIKRTGDIILSAAVLVLLCWLLGLTAIGVKLSSPGPVLFRQERVGKNGRHFTMYKFRSMPVETDDSQAWSTDDDARKTRFGALIRKLSIDELPQFWNVLRGDMSAVGPRPEIPYFVEQFTDEHEAYMVRHQVRPGITGLAQVSGLRGDTSIAERLRCDIRYVETWTPGLDARIIGRTVFGGFINNEKLR